jgi:GAF domain-containing protein
MKLIPNTYNWEGWAQRALALIRGCHIALAQAKEEEPFLQEICRLLVEIGGYPLAWVGLAEKNKAKKIVRVAHAGMALGLLELLPRTWSEEGPGRDPTGTAIRTGQMVFCPDIQSEPACALRRGGRNLGLDLLSGPASEPPGSHLWSPDPVCRGTRGFLHR